MGSALAYFITWTTYGTRLHGDWRGSVDRDHAVYGSPKLVPNASRLDADFQVMKRAPVTLTPEERETVRETLLAHIAHRHWSQHAINVRTNHVHVVVANPGTVPEQMMGEFKSWSTRRLHEAGHFADYATVWTPHGSTRYIFDADDLLSAIAYVETAQDDVRRFAAGHHR